MLNKVDVEYPSFSGYNIFIQQAFEHGIRFETASKVFADKNKLIRYDEEHSWEERYDVLGKAGKVLVVQK